MWEAWDLYKPIMYMALAYNAVVVVGFIVAWFLEVRPVEREKRATGNEFAAAVLERAEVNFRRFVVLSVSIQAVLLVIYAYFAEPPYSRKHFGTLVWAPSMLIAYSSFLFYRKPYYERLRELVSRNNVPVLIDLNHQILDRILDWRIEAASFAGLLASSVLYFGYEMTWIMSAILLMFYVSIRTRKYLLRQGLCYWYRSLLYGNVLSQSLKLLELWDAYKDVATLTAAAQALIFTTGALICVQLALVLARLPGVRRSMRDTGTAASL